MGVADHDSGHAADEPSKRPGFRSALRENRRQRRKITRALDADKRRRAGYLTRRFLNSFAAKRVAVRRANMKMNPDQRIPRSKEFEVAAALDPYRGTKEKVRVWGKTKKSGGIRPIMFFGIENRALQYLVYGALKPWAGVLIHPAQFAVVGGRHRACSEVMDALREGHTWAAKLDIREFFLNLDEDEVPSLLPVPRAVSQRVVVSRHLNTKATSFRDKDVTAQAKARRGIPQGSAISNLVAEVLLAPVFEGLPEGSCVVAFCDDFLLLGRDEQEVITILKTLRCALESHPAGPLACATDGPGHVEDGFDFLGYRFGAKGCEPRVEPAAGNFIKFWKQMQRYFESDEFTDDEALDEGWRYISSWCNAFKEWEEVREFEVKRRYELMSARLTFS